MIINEKSKKKKRSRSDFGHHQSLWFCCMVSHWQLTKNSTKFSRSLQWAPRQFFFEWGKRELEESLFWKIKEITKNWKIKIVRFSLFIFFFLVYFLLEPTTVPFCSQKSMNVFPISFFYFCIFWPDEKKTVFNKSRRFKFLCLNRLSHFCNFNFLQ